MFKRIWPCVVVVVVGAGLTACPPQKSGRERITQEQMDSGAMTLQEIVEFGKSLNSREWTVADGFGNGRNGATPPNFNRLTGPDTVSCMSCHGTSNVVMGWGSNAANLLVAFDDPVNPTVAGSNVRNTLMVHGTAWLELLAGEMTADLRAIRQQTIEDAANSVKLVTTPLESKGVSFGNIAALPDGVVDSEGIIGADVDLIIRPTHFKGQEASLRIFARGALNRHQGIQSTDFLLSLDPTRDPATWDEDEDGVVDELNEGELTAMVVHMLSLPAPVEARTGDPEVERGRQLMTALGCTECHRPSLRVEDPVWRFRSSAGNMLEIDLTDPALGPPRLQKNPDGSVDVPLWGDLKRHDIGPESHDPLDQPVDQSIPFFAGGAIGEQSEEFIPDIPRELFLTTELWGVGDTEPYWHDGSSPTIEDAILRHGGEAQASRDAFASATAAEQSALLEFLAQLRIGLVAELTGVNKDALDPRDLPLNALTEHFDID